MSFKNNMYVSIGFLVLSIWSLRGMQETGQQRALDVERGRGRVGDMPLLAMQVYSADQERRGRNSPVMQIISQIMLQRAMQRSQAEQIFSLQIGIDELRKQVDAKEKELDVLTRRIDWDRQEEDAFDILARELENGGSFTVCQACMQERTFIAYMRDQACYARNPIILQKLLEADPSIKTDVQNLGLYALTDDPQEITESAEKMLLLVQAGVDVCQIKSVDSFAHTLVHDGKESVIRELTQKNPALLCVVDGKQRSLIDVAVERYIRALSEKGRRSSEYDEAYKILRFLLSAQSVAVH